MSWIDAYRAYDDDTLTTLANAGLLRRAGKDLEAGRIAWAEQGEAGGVISVDGQRVTLDARGPQQAHCDCPAPGICKHILGAALWLRALEAPAGADTAADADKPAATVAAATPAPPLAPDVLTEIRQLDPAALFKAAGVAAVRRAAATPAGLLNWQQQGAVVLLELPDLGFSCRWVAGAGFAGMISEVPDKERKAAHLIALAALRQTLGCALPWPDGSRPTPAGTAGLGDSERAFLAQVAQMLDELLGGGLAHVSSVTAARLFALNMSARSEGLPRLAALLRNLGGMADLLVRRDHRVQEHDALALMAQIHALCTALQHSTGDTLTTLRGRLRRDFDDHDTLELLPLGAWWWQTRGGARGLSVGLWDFAAGTLRQAVIARPDGSDTGFTRYTAWSALSLWSGAGPAETLCTGLLRLQQPRLSEDGRLALGGSTRAEALAALQPDDPRIASLGWDDWGALADALRATTGLAATPIDLALLRPRAQRPPTLDEAAQRLNWAVQDKHGCWLELSIPCGDEHRARVDTLDRVCARHAPVHAILVQVDRSHSGCELMPVALLSHDKDGAWRPISLDFAREPARQQQGLANRILRLFEQRREQAPALPPPTLLSRLLGPLRDTLALQASTGRLTLPADSQPLLQALLGQLRAVGLDSLAHATDEHLQHPNASTLLKAVWLDRLLTTIEGLPYATPASEDDA